MARDANLIYCRAVLKSTIQDVRRFAPTVNTWVAWVNNFQRDQWEFHFQTFYWHGRADNAYEARSAGWQAWLKKQGCPEYQDAPGAEPFYTAEAGWTETGIAEQQRRQKDPDPVTCDDCGRTRSDIGAK